MSLRSHPFFFFLTSSHQRSLFCSSSAICLFSLGMSPFDLLFKKKKKRHPLLGRRQGEEGVLEDGARLLKEVISSCDGRGCYPIRMFSAKEIERAIQQPYHRDGYYYCYEGTHEGRQIIIKVYREAQARYAAFNEIASVTQVSHGNVVKLLGCCFEMEQPILIYEKVHFILTNRLFEANPSSLISWEHRLRIAIEIAYAITYLHTATDRPIVHRNIKCSNILLDENYKSKLADFSLSLKIPLGETHVKLHRISGTAAYLDPDYVITSIVSEKTDVYSYGVVLFELFSGKPHEELIEVFNGKARGELNEKTCKEFFELFSRVELRELNEIPLNLSDFIKEEIDEKEMALKLILGNGLSMNVRQLEQAMACMELAGKCIKYNPDERPPMKDVTQQLLQIERAELCPQSSSSS